MLQAALMYFVTFMSWWCDAVLVLLWKVWTVRVTIYYFARFLDALPLRFS